MRHLRWTSCTCTGVAYVCLKANRWLHHHVTKKHKFNHNVVELAHTTWSVRTVVLGFMHDSAERIRRTCVLELHVLE